MLTQKVFEYLGARRPILAIVPKGASRHLLSQTGGAWLVDPGDQERIAEVLRQWLYGAEPPPQNSDALASLTRSGQARQLAEVLDRVAGLAVGADQKTA
jgi:hypothetical protein